MTETVPDPQETTGRTRIVVTLITASVPVVIAAISLMPQIMGKAAADPGPGPEDPVTVIKVDPRGDLDAPPLKRWKITGALDATEGSGPVYAGLHLMPLEQSLETMTDDQGRFAFDDVPAGAYCLLVKTFGAGDGHYIKLRIEKRGAGPMEEFSVEGTPVDFTIIEK
jgi:hypothetical protein